MKTNAIIRICIYSLLILLLLGLLLGGIGFRNRYSRPRSHEETYAPRRLEEMEVDRETDQILECKISNELNVRKSPSSGADVVDILYAGDQITVLKTASVNGVIWGKIESPVEGWINMNYAEPVDEQTDVPIDASGTAFPATVSSMEIAWAVGRITIVSGDVEEVLVSIDEDPEDESARVILKNGNRLEIDFIHDTDWYFGLNNLPEKDLTITVPRGLKLGEIELDIASAQVELRDLTASEVDIDGASGTCVIENCNVDVLNVDTASGDVEFSGSLETLDFDAASANFVGVFESNPRSLKMDSMSGDLELTLPQGCGFTATIDAMSSRFNADQEVKLVNGAYVCGDGACRINVSGMSGDVTVHMGK